MSERVLRVSDGKTDVLIQPLPANARVVIVGEDHIAISREGSNIDGRTIFTPAVSPKAPEAPPEAKEDDVDEEQPTPAQETQAIDEADAKPKRKPSVSKKK